MNNLFLTNWFEFSINKSFKREPGGYKSKINTSDDNWRNKGGTVSEEPSNETNSDEATSGVSKSGSSDSNKATSNGSGSSGERPKSEHFLLQRYTTRFYLKRCVL